MARTDPARLSASLATTSRSSSVPWLPSASLPLSSSPFEPAVSPSFLYAIHCLILSYTAPTPPRTINKEWQEASNERALDQKMNPLTGTPRSLLSLVYFAHRSSRYRVRGLQRQGLRPRQLELRERYYITVNQLHTCLFNITVPTCDGLLSVSLPSAVL